MKINIYSVHDSKAEAFIQPWYAPNDGHALRSFEQASNDPACQFSNFPGDYTLFHLGSFDSENAKIETLQTPKNLGLALQFKKDIESL